MSKANLTVKFQGIKGGKFQCLEKSMIELFIDNEYDNNIIVDAFQGNGKTYKKRDECLVKISNKHMIVFKGTFEELIKKLK